MPVRKPFISGILLALAFAGAGVASNTPSPDAQILENYILAAQESQYRLRGYSMEVDIDAALLKLKKQGSVHALRRISSLGKVTYDAFRWAGDNLIKTDVIARYLKAEAEGQREDISITPANYKFKYKGLTLREGREVHVYEVKPQKKRVGLFKGEIWVDPETYLPVRESGTFVKNPSVFLKKMEFVREYEIRDGIAFPQRIESKVDVRLIGKTELTVNYTSFMPESAEQALSTSTGTAE
jgi:hypothetical protein